MNVSSGFGTLAKGQNPVGNTMNEGLKTKPPRVLAPLRKAKTLWGIQ